MAVNGCFCFEVHKSASIHHKSASVHHKSVSVHHKSASVHHKVCLDLSQIRMLICLEDSYFTLLSFKYEYFSYTNAWLHFKRPLLTPQSLWSTFMMDRCTFMDFKIERALNCHYKAWKSQDIFFVFVSTPIVFV